MGHLQYARSRKTFSTSLFRPQAKIPAVAKIPTRLPGFGSESQAHRYRRLKSRPRSMMCILHPHISKPTKPANTGLPRPLTALEPATACLSRQGKAPHHSLPQWRRPDVAQISIRLLSTAGLDLLPPPKRLSEARSVQALPLLHLSIPGHPPLREQSLTILNHHATLPQPTSRSISLEYQEYRHHYRYRMPFSMTRPGVVKNPTVCLRLSDIQASLLD